MLFLIHLATLNSKKVPVLLSWGAVDCGGCDYGECEYGGCVRVRVSVWVRVRV